MPFHLEQLFGDLQLIIVCLLNMVINVLTLTTNAARVSGAESKKVATALSLFNVFQVSFRMLNLVYAPLMANIVDNLAKEGRTDLILIKLNFVIFSAAVGSFIGFLLLPTFIQVYHKGIRAMEKYGSVPRIALALLNPKRWGSVIECFRKPSMLGVNPLQHINQIPRSFLIFNLLGVSLWTVGVLASTYASAIDETLVRTAIHLSGIVNGIGTIFLFVLVEPVSALVVDHTVSGKRPPEHVKTMVIFLALGSILGNLLGMLIFIPSSNYILWMSRLIDTKFGGK